MTEFRGSDIPGIYSLTSMVDKALVIFRQRMFAYLAITLTTFGICALGVAWAYAGNIVEDISKFLEDPFEYLDRVSVFYYLFALPTLFADFALQEYTSYLVRNREIHWLRAISGLISLKFLHFLALRFLAFLPVFFVAKVTFVIALVPFVGFFIYFLLLSGIHAMTAGMAHAIIVEERPGFLGALARNWTFASGNLGISVFGAFAGYTICLALLVSGVTFVVATGYIVFQLLYGTTGNFSNGQDFMSAVTYALVFLLPILLSVFFVPVANLFFSVMYYHFRSEREGFHIENNLNIRLKEIQEAEERARAEEFRNQPGI